MNTVDAGAVADLGSVRAFAVSVQQMEEVRAEFAEAVRLGQLRPDAASVETVRLFTAQGPHRWPEVQGGRRELGQNRLLRGRDQRGDLAGGDQELPGQVRLVDHDRRVEGQQPGLARGGKRGVP